MLIWGQCVALRENHEVAAAQLFPLCSSHRGASVAAAARHETVLVLDLTVKCDGARRGQHGMCADWSSERSILPIMWKNGVVVGKGRVQRNVAQCRRMMEAASRQWEVRGFLQCRNAFQNDRNNPSLLLIVRLSHQCSMLLPPELVRRRPGMVHRLRLSLCSSHICRGDRMYAACILPHPTKRNTHSNLVSMRRAQGVRFGPCTAMPPIRAGAGKGAAQSRRALLWMVGGLSERQASSPPAGISSSRPRLALLRQPRRQQRLPALPQRRVHSV